MMVMVLVIMALMVTVARDLHGTLLHKLTNSTNRLCVCVVTCELDVTVATTENSSSSSALSQYKDSGQQDSAHTQDANKS